MKNQTQKNTKKTLTQDCKLTYASQFYKNLSKQERDVMIKEASIAFGNFLDTLKIDWKGDESLNETPDRVARMYVNELLAGRFRAKPKVKFFNLQPTPYNMVSMIGPIAFSSTCAHHFLPFQGQITIGIVGLEKNQVPGLSKFSRICRWHASRAQMQEDLGQQILEDLNTTFYNGNGSIGIFIKAQHNCCSCRGIRDLLNSLSTLHTTTKFEKFKDEFLRICTNTSQK